MRTRRLAALFATGLAATMLMAPAAGAASAWSMRQVDPSVPISGAGATFPCNFYEQIRADVRNRLGLSVNYQCVGSGGGQANFRSRTVDFGGSDVPMPNPQPAQPFFHVATVLGSVVLAYNANSNIPADLRLDADVIGRIWSGAINRWNDPAIAALNPGASLPDLGITLVYRSDSSGTSAVMSGYLTQASGQGWRTDQTFRNAFPSGPPAGSLAQPFNDGVANGVRDNQGAMGYVELSFARERNLPFALVRNAQGQFVKADANTVAQAMDSATVNADGTLSYNYANLPGYPISSPTYAFVYADYGDPRKAANIRELFTYMVTTGQERADRLGYAPLGSALRQAALANIAKVGPGAPPTTAAPATTAAPVTTRPTAPGTTAPGTATTAAPTETTAAPTQTTAAPTETTATTAAVTTTVAQTTTSAAATTTTSVADESALGEDGDGGGGGGSAVGIIIAVLAVLGLAGGGGYLFMRSRSAG